MAIELVRLFEEEKKMESLKAEIIGLLEGDKERAFSLRDIINGFREYDETIVAFAVGQLSGKNPIRSVIRLGEWHFYYSKEGK